MFTLKLLNSYPSLPTPDEKNIVRGVFPPKQHDVVEIFNLYSSKQWTALDELFFLSSGAIQTSLPYLTACAFFYYLPAVIRFTTGPSFDETSAIMIDHLIEIEKTILEDNDSDYKKEFLKLTHEQRITFEDFMRYIKTNPKKFFLN